MKTLHNILLAAVFVLCGSAANAQWNTLLSNDQGTRPFNDTVYITAADVATTASLASTGDNVVADYDISSGTTVDTITQPIMPRTLGIQVYEASGTTITGTVTIFGKNQFGQNAIDTITVRTGGGFALTRNAYQTITGISYNLSNTASGDLLRIGTVGWGFRGNPSSIANLTVIHTDDSAPASSARLATTTFTYDQGFQTIRPSIASGNSWPTIAGNDELWFRGYSDFQTQVSTGFTQNTVLLPTGTGFPNF